MACLPPNEEDSQAGHAGMIPRQRCKQAADPASVAEMASSTTDDGGCPQHAGYPKGPPMADRSGIPSHLEQTAEIVSAYVPNNSLRQNELPALQRAVHDAPKRTALGEAAARTPTVNPPERITKPVMPDYIVCLEVGEKFQSLKRHLRAVPHDTMPDQHREKRGMPRDGVW